ncbi:PREDICTED: venom acid phosphatase Acph-1-like [Papilio xuthus]|uniref:acid phosphatase n=2 Tax=Papilio xuthus TaxID=66420 RepID=A0A194PS41_PAPXU|nr:PREDICTED: venom acid phosphatase Acph-1-like [Papilio xuthus]KPI93945.1 Venom acid phosphatase Acph-1 [Papilio xuthus]
MGLAFVLLIAVGLGGGGCSKYKPAAIQSNNKLVHRSIDNTEPVLVFSIFRHGDRTPDQEELDKYPAEEKSEKLFFPFGKKALTNKGKQRGFKVGEYLRERYDEFISQLYLPDEIKIRTTDYDRTKMTALTAMSALYPPLPPQRWNPALNWQPVPYDTLEYQHDDLLYWYNCPRYTKLRNSVYELPEVKKWLEPYESFYSYLSDKTGTNITTPEDVFFLDNLFQTLENVGVKPPKWAQEVMPKIKEMTKIEYAIEYYDDDLIRIASGVLLGDIVNASTLAVAGDLDQPKMRLYSAHENNVAGLMAAARVFQPHQPKYGSTFSLELRRRNDTGQYGFLAVYAAIAGGPDVFLPVDGCGDSLFCDFDTFVNITKNVINTRERFADECYK